MGRTAREPSATRADVVLAAVPLAILAGACASVAVGAPLRTGVTAGGVVAMALINYAMFGDPPGRGGRTGV
ncbi:MAG: hypothetical protein ABEJ80_08345 [Halarchaeum sp.]